MKNEIYLPIVGIAVGEIMMLSGHVYIGLVLHVINLQAITLALIFSDLSIEKKNLIQTLLLLLQMRILNLAMPQFFTTKLLWYPLVYGVMFISIYYVTKQQNITSKDIGIDFNRWYLYIPLALLIAAAMAMLEFKILDPVALISNLKIQ